MAREIADYISEHHVMDTPFNIIKYGLTKGKNLAHDRTLVQEFSAAGTTWWIDEIFSSHETLNQIQKRIASGPPR